MNKNGLSYCKKVHYQTKIESVCFTFDQFQNSLLGTKENTNEKMCFKSDSQLDKPTTIENVKQD